MATVTLSNAPLDDQAARTIISTATSLLGEGQEGVDVAIRLVTGS